MTSNPHVIFAQTSERLCLYSVLLFDAGGLKSVFIYVHDWEITGKDRWISGVELQMTEFRWKTSQIRNNIYLVLKITVYTAKKYIF